METKLRRHTTIERTIRITHIRLNPFWKYPMPHKILKHFRKHWAVSQKIVELHKTLNVQTKCWMHKQMCSGSKVDCQSSDTILKAQSDATAFIVFFLRHWSLSFHVRQRQSELDSVRCQIDRSEVSDYLKKLRKVVKKLHKKSSSMWTLFPEIKVESEKSVSKTWKRGPSRTWRIPWKGKGKW
jgi:hypothetical protein